MHKYSKVNHLDYLVFAMMRSGYHAVMYWLFKSMNRKIHFYNNCCCDLRKEHSQLKGTIEKFPGTGKAVVFGSMEDFPLTLYKRFRRNIQINDDCKIIIIYRDPFNWIASSLKSRDKRKSIHMFKYWFQNQLKIEIPPRLGIYEIMLRDVFPTFTSPCVSQGNVIKINFVKWFRDASYRKSIAKQFNCDPSPNTDHVSSHGGGSSFDGRRKPGSSLDVLNRYREYVNDKKFIDLTRHEWVQDLQKKVMEE